MIKFNTTAYKVLTKLYPVLLLGENGGSQGHLAVGSSPLQLDEDDQVAGADDQDRDEEADEEPDEKVDVHPCDVIKLPRAPHPASFLDLGNFYF